MALEESVTDSMIPQLDTTESSFKVVEVDTPHFPSILKPYDYDDNTNPRKPLRKLRFLVDFSSGQSLILPSYRSSLLLEPIQHDIVSSP